MKKLLLISLLVSIPDIMAQCQIVEYGNFKIQNGDLIHQIVTDTSLNIEVAARQLQSLGSIKNVQVSTNYIVADFENLAVDYKSLGRKWGNTPIVFNNYTLDGKITLELKEHRYRTTITGLKLRPLLGYNHTPEDFAASALKAKRDSIRPAWATENILGLYDEFLTVYFKIKSQGRDEW